MIWYIITEILSAILLVAAVVTFIGGDVQSAIFMVLCSIVVKMEAEAIQGELFASGKLSWKNGKLVHPFSKDES